MWYKGKEYYSVNKWVGIFNRDYKDKGIKVNAHDIHQLFGYYKIPKLKINGNGEIVENGRRVLYPVNLVNQVRTMKEDFIYVLSNITEYGVSNGKEFYIPYNEKEITEPTYKNDENDMEKYSDNLIDKYQFENKKKIKLTESQIKRIFENFNDEGVSWKNKFGGVNMTIDSKTDDKSNLYSKINGNENRKGWVDTRVFGTKKDILHGDGTTNINSLTQSLDNTNNIINMYKQIIEYAKNGFNGDLSLVKNKSILSKINEFKQKNDIEGLITYANYAIKRNYDSNINMYQNTYNRANNLKNDTDRTERYSIGYVNGTNIKVISLFTMGDFNFSDAIKHGKVRQNPLTDDVFGIDSDERETVKTFSSGNNKLRKIDTYYDDRYFNNDLMNNFSLSNNNIGDNVDHFKKSFTNKNDYNSVVQFMDKSIIYANHALKKEGFKPDFIVSCPSSSKFNEYYCLNLSRKIGIPYLKKFFERNVINVSFGEDVEKKMIEDGIPSSMILKTKNAIRESVYSEISSKLMEEIEFLYKSKLHYFFKIMSELESINDEVNNIINEDSVKYLLSKLIMNMFYSNDDINIIKNHIIKQINKYYRNSANSYNIKYLKSPLSDLSLFYDIFIKHLISIHGIWDDINETLIRIQKKYQLYEDKLEKGYKLNLSRNRFKITDVDKTCRKYLTNVYIISDKVLNKDKELYTKYKNAKYLIFDEDINSGQTMRLTIDALADKTDVSSNNVMCLVNAYSSSGN